jgi:hypothetical protein
MANHPSAWTGEKPRKAGNGAYGSQARAIYLTTLVAQGRMDVARSLERLIRYSRVIIAYRATHGSHPPPHHFATTIRVGSPFQSIPGPKRNSQAVALYWRKETVFSLLIRHL